MRRTLERQGDINTQTFISFDVRCKHDPSTTKTITIDFVRKSLESIRGIAVIFRKHLQSTCNQKVGYSCLKRSKIFYENRPKRLSVNRIIDRKVFGRHRFQLRDRWKTRLACPVFLRSDRSARERRKTYKRRSRRRGRTALIPEPFCFQYCNG